MTKTIKYICAYALFYKFLVRLLTLHGLITARLSIREVGSYNGEDLSLRIESFAMMCPKSYGDMLSLPLFAFIASVMFKSKKRVDEGKPNNVTEVSVPWQCSQLLYTVKFFP